MGEQNNLVSNDNLHVDSDEHSGSWCGFALRAYHAFRVYDAAVVGVQGLGFRVYLVCYRVHAAVVRTQGLGVHVQKLRCHAAQRRNPW